jgi:hypothetical protein
MNSPIKLTEWFWIAGVIMALTIAILAGLHYFGKL